MKNSADTLEAIWQGREKQVAEGIRQKEYCHSLEAYKGSLLLVGINYNKKTQEHTCKIESYRKEESV